MKVTAKATLSRSSGPERNSRLNCMRLGGQSPPGYEWYLCVGGTNGFLVFTQLLCSIFSFVMLAL